MHFSPLPIHFHYLQVQDGTGTLEKNVTFKEKNEALLIKPTFL